MEINMSFMLALKAFFKAWKEPLKAQAFLNETEKKIEVQSKDHSHLRLLALLQQSGRLIHFFQEDIHDFTDAQVGAAVRLIHQDCGKSLEELVPIRPLMPEKQGSTGPVPIACHPAAIKS